MATSPKKAAANRLNGQKSHGPNNTASTRFNATKHGLLSKGVTELDEAEGYRNLLKELVNEKKPQGPTENFFVESAALEMVRARRARRLEAEFITSVLNPPKSALDLPELPTLDPGLPASLDFEPVQRLVNCYQRYESVSLSRLLRMLHDLERIQRMRQGERLSAPAALDVTVETIPVEAGLSSESDQRHLSSTEGCEQS